MNCLETSLYSKNPWSPGAIAGSFKALYQLQSTDIPGDTELEFKIAGTTTVDTTVAVWFLFAENPLVIYYNGKEMKSQMEGLDSTITPLSK